MEILNNKKKRHNEISSPPFLTSLCLSYANLTALWYFLVCFCGGKSQFLLKVDLLNMPVCFYINQSFLIMVALFKIQDHGIVPDGSEEMTKSQHELYRRALTQELSRHAAVILRGTNTGKSFPLIWFFFKVLYAYNEHVFFFTVLLWRISPWHWVSLLLSCKLPDIVVWAFRGLERDPRTTRSSAEVFLQIKVLCLLFLSFN